MGKLQHVSNKIISWGIWENTNLPSLTLQEISSESAQQCTKRRGFGTFWWQNGRWKMQFLVMHSFSNLKSCFLKRDFFMADWHSTNDFGKQACKKNSLPKTEFLNSMVHYFYMLERPFLCQWKFWNNVKSSPLSQISLS